MVQWINVLQNNSFVNPMWLPFCAKNWSPSHSGTGSYGRPAGWQAGCKADESVVK